MNLFQDTGFDMLPKNPAPGLQPVIQPEVTIPPPAFFEPPAGDPGDGDGKMSGWTTLVFITIATVAIVGVAVYIEERKRRKSILRIDGSRGF